MSTHPNYRRSTRCGLMAALVLLTGIAAAPRALSAQAGNFTSNATVLILPPGLIGTGIQDLKFGTLAVGGTVWVPPAAAPAGALTSSAGWRFSNVRKKTTLSYQLTLPSTLVRGAFSIPINWNRANYANLCVSRGGNSTCVIASSFNPGTSPTGTVTLPANLPGNDFDVTTYVGARLISVPSVPPGVYTAVVTMTLAYVN